MAYETETTKKPVADPPKPRVIYTMFDKDHGNIRIVACGEKLTPEKRLGTDAMGVEAWQFIQWDRWMQPIAEKHLNLLAARMADSD